MKTPFQEHDVAVVFQRTQETDPNAKHMEFKDAEGTLFAKMDKVYKKGGFLNLFAADSYVHAELKDAAGTLLLTSTSYRGATARECKVELHDISGVLIGTLFDAPFGVDFEAPDGTVLGRARRGEDLKTEPHEVDYAYTDAAQQSVGSCERRFPKQNVNNMIWDALDDIALWDTIYTSTGASTWGLPVQKVTLTAPVDEKLRLFMHLFPALQMLRFSRNW